ncbi:acyl--CoA ligase [Schaalia sp. ZJ405]|uniref:class I adenylate-forming enzyme family protein n=1 Tax=Schaalia sp. ZJ405 TaxID=2709403 RepID=UPI0013EBD1DA|nr:class I adenylate-forming enzyme family protein [Schaalia sp. ZJ405]QPK81750.1 acyl--CoA ligase [Schaalia sp. ZJ405]
MLSGDTLWPASVIKGLNERTINGRDVRTFEGAPESLDAMLSATAQRLPNKVAIYTEDGHTFTFADVRRMVTGFARYLHTTVGIGHGDRVGVLLDNGIDFVTAFYALNRLGAIIVPLPGKFRRAEITALVQRAQVRLIVCQPQQAAWFPDYATVVSSSTSCAFGLPLSPIDEDDAALPHLPVPRADADAILLFTSGTTSQSKGVLLTNANATHAVLAYQRVLELTAEDSTIIAVPIYHVTGMIAILALFIHLGGSIHIQKRMDGMPFVREIFARNITFIHASPTVFALMLDQRERFPQLPSVHTIGCGAAHMPVHRIRDMHEWMPHMQFRTIYGLSESCSPAFVFPCDAATSAHLGSSGIPIPGLDVKICDADGHDLGFNAEGEIYLRGANIARGYDGIVIDEDEAGRGTAAGAFRTDGWFATGDIGLATPDGYVYVHDRKKDVINRGGEKICCIDVEEELRRLDEIDDAALVGVPDDLYGEVPAAAVVVRPGAHFDAELVRTQLNGRLARYRVPVSFMVVDALPVTAGGKIDKNTIRALFAHRV